MKLALIGCGEVGFCYAQAWVAAGHTVIGVAELRHDEEMADRVHACGARLHAAPGPWLHEADMVVSAVYGRDAREVVLACLPHLHADAVYADYTTASAADMQAAAAAAAEQGRCFTDVAIMGAIALQGDSTPLLCAGTGAERVVELAQSCGTPARIAAGQAGDAVRLKLLRSIMTKGMESLAVEAMVAAESMGLRDALYDVLADIDATPLTQFMDSFARSHVSHAQRRLAEVREAREQLVQAGLEPLVLDGVERLFDRTSRGIQTDRDQGVAPPADDVKARLDWLTVLARTPH